MRKKTFKILFACVASIVVLGLLIMGVRFLLLKQKVKNTNIMNDIELVELCDYLYDTHDYSTIYDVYSQFFQNEKAFIILEDLGLSEAETTKCITQWGARYIFASSNVNQRKDASEEVSCFLLQINNQNSDLLGDLIKAMTEEIYNNNGMKTNLFESFELKKFLAVLGDAVEKTNIPVSAKQQYYDFINGQYALIGDIKSAHISSWKANGMDSLGLTENVGAFNIWGYVFRFVIVFACVCVIVLSIVLIRKRKKIIINLVSIFLCIIVLVVSFLTFDIKTPDIDSSIGNTIEIIKKQYLPDDNVYNVFAFDCDKYYGTISISLEDDERKQIEISKNSFVQKNIDGENATLSSYVACVRDNYTLPNCVVGTVIIYNGNIRMAVKYTYKNENKFGLIKYLTFTEYFSKPTIELEEIIENIELRSLSVIEKIRRDNQGK